MDAISIEPWEHAVRPPPTRLVNIEAPRRTWGSRVDVLAAMMGRTDPLAEDVVAVFSEMAPGKGKRLLDRALDEGIHTLPSAPPELVRLFEQIDEVPFWVDWDQLDLGGAAFLRCGVVGLFALGAGSLPLTYAPPGANKPLVFSRRLVEMAPRRLFDTMRFQLETCTKGGLRRFSDGFKITLRVRLVHAQMRRLLLASGRWDAAAWGAPVNQADQAYTNILFSAYPLGWLRRLGFHFTPDESDAVMQLWRYSGYLLGLSPTLLSSTEAEARRLGALYEAMQGPPDDDARALTKALWQAVPALGRAVIADAPWFGDLWLALSRFMLGDDRMDALGVPRTRYRHAIPWLRAAIAQGEAVRRAARGTDLAVELGTAFERRLILGGTEPSSVGVLDAVLDAMKRHVEGLRRS